VASGVQSLDGVRPQPWQRDARHINTLSDILRSKIF